MHYRTLQPSPLHLNPGASHFQQVPLLPEKVCVVFQQGRKSWCKPGKHSEQKRSLPPSKKPQWAWFFHVLAFTVHGKHMKAGGEFLIGSHESSLKYALLRKTPDLFFFSGCVQGTKRPFGDHWIACHEHPFHARHSINLELWAGPQELHRQSK